MFIPFLGAVIGAARSATTRWPRRAWALPGPILGTLAAAACVAIVGLATHSGLLEALGYIGFLLNLFNLLPVVPLDGGRAMAAMAPWMWFLGFGALVVLDFITPNPILLIIMLVRRLRALPPLAAAPQRRRASRPPTTASRRATALLVGAVYIGLIVALALGMHSTYVHRTIPA